MWGQTYQDVLILEWRHLGQLAIRINGSCASRRGGGFATSTSGRAPSHCGLAWMEAWRGHGMGRKPDLSGVGVEATGRRAGPQGNKSSENQ